MTNKEAIANLGKINNMKTFIEYLENISLNVIGLQGTDYEGLIGTIDRVLTKNNGETNSDFKMAIVVDFQEPEYPSIKSTHPHLNGTSIHQVIFTDTDDSIRDLGFFRNINSNFAHDLNGKIVCPSCYVPLNRFIETKYDDTNWYWDEEEKKYIKECERTSEGKKCDNCYYELEGPQASHHY